MTQPISLEELSRKIKTTPPNNTDRREGWALVNVLPEEYYSKQHIPGSINIPYENLNEFTARYDKEKELVVYCANVQCSAGPDTAKKLQEQGFSKVRDFPGGTKEWFEGAEKQGSACGGSCAA
jgi:rhodanese-related sulfurtransferase